MLVNIPSMQTGCEAGLEVHKSHTHPYTSPTHHNVQDGEAELRLSQKQPALQPLPHLLAQQGVNRERDVQKTQAGGFTPGLAGPVGAVAA